MVRTKLPNSWHCDRFSRFSKHVYSIQYQCYKIEELYEAWVMVRWGDPQAECQMSTINKHYCPVSADIKHTSSILPASYTSPASPWLISDFNLFGRPLREGSLLFIYIVRFIYRDGETRSEEERRSLSAHLSARTGSLWGPAGSVSPQLLIPHLGLPQSHILGFQIFCTQSTINNGWTEDQDCKIHRKIQLVATLRSGSLPGWWWWARWGDQTPGTRRHN